MHYLYILYSESSELYYVGQTQNVEVRLLQHNESPSETFTYKHRPWKLRAVFSCNTRSTAVRMEKLIKKQKSRKFIEGLIETSILHGEFAQLTRVFD